MSGSSLSKRLARIRGSAAIRGDSSAGEKQHPQPVGYAPIQYREVPGWVYCADGLLTRVCRFPLPDFPAVLDGSLSLLFPREFPSTAYQPEQCFPYRVEQLLFFDLETTGLSRGAGTVAFMAGLARIGGAGQNRFLEIRQLLMTDYPGEVSFLTELSACVLPDTVLVSFNGKSFDSRILDTRFIMNGMRAPHAKAAHLDLMYPSRRLWKHRTGSARLKDIEEQILNLRRIDDLPGSEAPDAWFDFLRRGDFSRLVRVGDHNRDDCLALAQLLNMLNCEIAESRGRAALYRAKPLRQEERYQEALPYLRLSAQDGDRLALYLLAVDCEHRLSRLEEALDAALLLNDERRIRRLRIKIEKRDGHQP